MESAPLRGSGRSAPERDASAAVGDVGEQLWQHLQRMPSDEEGDE